MASKSVTLFLDIYGANVDRWQARQREKKKNDVRYVDGWILKTAHANAYD